MPALSNSLITNVNYFAGRNNQSYSNIMKGGQLGIGPQIPNIDAATPLVFPNAICIVTHVPTMFDEITYAPEILTSLIEKHAQNVDGISPNLTLSEVEGYTMQNGQVTKMPGITKYDELSPSFTFRELQGNIINRFFETWLSMMSEPNTGYSNLSSMLNTEDIDPLLYSYFSMDIAVIQPDITLLPKNIIDGFFFTCMFPKSAGGELGVKRQVGGDVETKERSVEFTGVLQRSNTTYRACQLIMETLGLHKANYDNQVPITTEIDNQLKDTGISQEIEDIVKTFKDI